MMKEDINMIGEFDQSKVSMQESDTTTGYSIIWYDITEIVKGLVRDKAPSVLEYVSKVEVEISDRYHDDDEDLIFYAKEEYEDIINAKYRQLGLFNEQDGLRIRNDARKIRLRFINGSFIDVSNSEWGFVFLI